MGIEPFLVASSLVGVLAQRLVRCLCSHCRESRPPDTAEASLLRDFRIENLYTANGCERCSGTGYRGRTGIFELLVVDAEMRTLVHDRASEERILRHARSTQQDLLQDGLSKVAAGVTSLDEVLRVTRSE
jgi:general secretion pathway protein E